PQLL
ncbi:wall surface anchor family domain protein, partial [Chlamydia psittaci 08-2626_L3]